MSSPKYQATWSSLKRHRRPEWLDDAKYGVYYHWGIYSVPECGPNGSWYPYNMYRESANKKRNNPQFKYHLETYGHPSKFGYKELIPQFTAEQFDPVEWVKIFKDAGAKFAGPVVEHHDGFSMWDSAINEWNAAKMGPKRDLVGDIAKEIKKAGLKFLVAFHHAENWYFFPHHRKDFDTSDPKYSGLYGPLHDTKMEGKFGKWKDGWNNQEPPSEEFLDLWKAKIIEVIDKYEPDLMWFDFGLGYIRDRYKKEVLAYFYNKAEELGKEVDVIYKDHDFAPGVGVNDFELGRSEKLTYNNWISDTSVDAIGAWSYVKNSGWKSGNTLIHNLIDRVAKNGYLLMNFGPRANGEFPEGAKNCFKMMGEWLSVNGEAIYGTTPWLVAGEGPTNLKKGGGFIEKHEVKYTSRDIRFTTKGNALYAICLGWPGDELLIRALRPHFKTLKKGERARHNVHFITKSEIKSVLMLGDNKDLHWDLTDSGLKIQMPSEPPCKSAYSLKIELR
jgi:alpha-L-fucosidase